MQLSRVINVLDVHNRAIPASLGVYPSGALLVQFEECGGKIDKPFIHDEDFAYWNFKEWSVIDVGGICSAQGRLARWIVIADGHKIGDN